MVEAYIYDHVRTPRGKGRASGSLHSVTPIELASTALRAIRDRNELDTAHVDDVMLGCVAPVGEQGADIARVAVINSDYAETTAGAQVNRFCASGLEAVNIAAGQIMSGQSDIICPAAMFTASRPEAVNIAAGQIMSGQSDMAIGGGVESMSRVPMGSDGGAWATDPAVAFHSYFVPQGISADLIATKFGYSRDDVDSYAVESQKRAQNAWDEGRFEGAIVPVVDINGTTVLDNDEHMRPETDMQSLASLDPSFGSIGEQFGFNSVAIQRYPEVEKIEHVHHAGNSSGIVDGAAAVLLGSKEIGEKLGLKARARIRGFASIGSEPTIMLTGPSLAAEKALKRAGMDKGDIDIWELNEAFAAVVLRFMEVLEIDHNNINVCGGAIAMGHPLGATGAMILGTVLDELERTGKSTALATLCVGAGMGTATIIERL